MSTLNRSFSLSRFKESRTSMLSYDFPLFVVITVMLIFGLTMVFSASIALTDNPRYEGVSHAYFFIRQLIFVGVGLFFAGIVFLVPMDLWQKYARPLLFVTVILLSLVFVRGIGIQINGASRWINLPFLNLQPSELMKFVIVIYAADFSARKHTQLHLIRQVVLPFVGVLFVVCGLIVVEPDLGATMVIVFVALGILFVAGASLKYFTFLMTTVVLGLIAFVITSPWRWARVMAFLDPFDPENAQGKGFQLTQSLMAFGQGGLTGSGLGAAVIKLAYLPEVHTDFIIAVVAEELGFLGVLFVIGLFVFIINRAFEIGKQAIVVDRPFSGLVAQGVGMWFGIQACVNLGVSTGLLPTKGLTLPLVSYGGSSMMMSLCALALLFRVDYENRQLMRGGHVYARK